MAQRIQLRRETGWRKPRGTVVVGRPTKWGNPFTVGDMVALPIDDGRDWLEAVITPEVAVALYRSWLAADERKGLVEDIGVELSGLDLACWCPLDQPCHADVLLEMANA